ncbi:energy-coupling factor transporter ATPase [Mycoplasma todarodis]|uniref:Energy-coupling factor transporter ATP-binding protein EcfA2 n=1 Tax=Mycoplasma todarodis TaxID=1937191 RepID=A0A4R0XQP8_9MOLU|nr:energy-coupling factor transporter ATPase [Mycoplasma todarodis]TCG10680.1 energy-coupling factor transporter ATPase [Mycoplasma todarodis]
MQIKTNKLTHIFDKGQPQEFTALKNVTATIEQGMSISIIGHTGSGKTTYIEHLNALILPTSGSIDLKFKIPNTSKKDKEHEFVVVERNIKASKRKIKKIKQIRKRIGIVFQFAEYQLFEETIEKDIMFGPITMGSSKEEAKELASKYLELVGLGKEYLKKSPFSLSGGQKRRVALAGILAMEPDTLVFDEPTAGLDPQGSQEILDIFDRLHKNGKTIIIVTHNLDDALARTDYTMMFSRGELIKFEDSYKVLKDTDYLVKNHLEPPKLLALVNKLEAKGIKLPKVKTIDELAEALNNR